MKNITSNIKGELMDFSSPKVMGILNITPDSFFEGSRKQTEKEIAERVIQIIEEGADIIDIGGYSSRPSAAYVDEAEEIRRLEYGLKILFREIPNAVVSVDTFRAEAARRSVEDFGAAIINDIAAGGLDEKMFETVARLQVPYIIMHMQGSPQTMMQYTQYENLMQEILLYFAEKVNQLHQMGVNDIWIDPGFGFSKTTAQNYEVLEKLEEFRIFELPILVGFSRKTMIREVIGTSPLESLNGTTALNMFSLTQGAHILRVHDVKEAVQAVKLYNKIKNANE
ncbi:dihydropteroate synthase [Bacteroidia bacterium]|nr:dihydropteroate synthase [Bacteroidia bacterium]GHT29694.1 dihydropteroate synthase [Bacteroidia bacterium]